MLYFLQIKPIYDLIIESNNIYNNIPDFVILCYTYSLCMIDIRNIHSYYIYIAYIYLIITTINNNEYNNEYEITKI
jgi:hypothetical protein